MHKRIFIIYMQSKRKIGTRKIYSYFF